MSLYNESVRFWNSIRLIECQRENPKLDEFIFALKAEYCNGSVLGKWFQVDGDYSNCEFTWISIYKYLKTSRLFVNETIIKNFNNYEVSNNTDITNSFYDITPYDLPGHLGNMLQFGGAYSNRGKDMKYFNIGLSAAMEIAGGDLNNVEITVSNSAWCSYFRDVAWDQTMAVCRPSEKLLFVMMATDTD